MSIAGTTDVRSLNSIKAYFSGSLFLVQYRKNFTSPASVEKNSMHCWALTVESTLMTATLRLISLTKNAGVSGGNAG